MGCYLSDMQSLSKYNQGLKYLLCIIDLFSKYAWVFPLKDKRGITIINAVQKIISKRRKPNKIWVDQGGKLYNNLFKRFLKINNIEMYSTYKEVKPLIAERFIKTMKNKIFKHMTAVSKYIYFDVLDDIVDRYNNTVHRTIKMKPIDVTSDLMLNTMKILMYPSLTSKLVMKLEFQNTKTCLLADTLKIGQKKFLLLAKLRILFLGHT